MISLFKNLLFFGLKDLNVKKLQHKIDLLFKMCDKLFTILWGKCLVLYQIER